MFRVFAAMVMLCAAGQVFAGLITWDLTGSGGTLAKQATFTDSTGTESVVAIAVNTEEPPTPVLTQTAQGLGVCTGSCGFLGDSSEVDNVGDDEAVVLDLGAARDLASITLTSLGINIWGISLWESYQVWGSNDSAVAGCTSGGLTCLTGSSVQLASGSSDSQAPLTVSLSGVYRYVIATLPGGSGDSLRVAGLQVNDGLDGVADVVAIPEPAGLALLGAGLLGLGLRRKRV